jgi:hypothetical protein
MKKPHLLYFPCRKAIYDWFAESSASGVAPVTVDLLAEQYEFERQPGNRESRITCHNCGDPGARYVVCCMRGQKTDKLYPRRYPRSQQCHQSGCASYAEELKPADIDVSGDRPAIARPSGDFAALRRELSDPEYSVVAMRRPNRNHVASIQGGSGQGTGRLTIGLQRLARALLQRSGVCEWRPQFAATRNERIFNGLIKGALEALVFESGPASDVLSSLQGVSFVPWSYLDSRDLKTPPAMTKCVGFGFLERLGPENEHGARALTLGNYPACPVVVPRRILDRECRNPRSPLLSHLAHPTWVMFVAGLYGGVWKAHALTAFRVTEVGLIPVDSHHEEMLVKRLVGEERAFARWLVPPPELLGSRFIPDFQLLDTAGRHYLEVAGLMAEAAYAENIARKQAHLGARLLVWDTRTKLIDFWIPYAA